MSGEWAGPLLEGLRRLALEVQDVPSAIGPHDLAQVVVAVDPDGRALDHAPGEDWLPARAVARQVDSGQLGGGLQAGQEAVDQL